MNLILCLNVAVSFSGLVSHTTFINVDFDSNKVTFKFDLPCDFVQISYLFQESSSH